MAQKQKDSFFEKQKAKKGIKIAIGNRDRTEIFRIISNIKNKEVFLEGLKDNYKVKILELCSVDLGEQGIDAVIDSLSYKAKFQFLMNVKNAHSSIQTKIIDGLSEKDVLDFLQTIPSQYEYDFERKHLLTNMKNYVLKLELLKHLKLRPSDILGELCSIKDIQNPDYLPLLRDHFEKIGCDARLDSFTCKLISNMGLNILALLESHKYSFEIIDLVGGEDNYYNLVKNYRMEFDNLDFDLLVNNREEFIKYQNYRNSFVTATPIVAKSIKDAMLEFSKHKDLIVDCLNKELTSKEDSILKSIIVENNASINLDEISGSEKLEEYPKIRQAYIENLIKTSPEDAAIYLLTGMNSGAYKIAKKSYIGKSQLDATMIYFEGQEESSTNMMVAHELIETLSQMPREHQQEVLMAWNKELAKEFDSEGSFVSKIRSSFNFAVDKTRKLYGQNLSESLKENPLPKAHPYKKDKSIPIIKLTGQKFKLLVHGLNAFGGGGTQSYANRDHNSKNYLCTSLISETCLGRADAEIYYGFDTIDKNALICQGYEDIYSGSVTTNADSFGSDKGDIAYTADDLARTTITKYNEVDLWRQHIDSQGREQKIEPNYIVCFDNVNERALEEAKAKGIPIVLIDTKVYIKQMEKNRQTLLEKDKPRSPEVQKLLDEKLQEMKNISREMATTMKMDELTVTEEYGMESGI